MAYRNFFLRSFFSFLFVFIYLLISYIDISNVFYLILIIYLIIVIEIIFNFKHYKILPLIYVFISFLFFNNIKFDTETFPTFNLFIFSVILFDIFSYIVGKIFGKNQLLKISPNKTKEGFWGGLILSFILSILFSYTLNIMINVNLILFIIVIILSAFIGDIIESFFKRKNKLKNSSELIPGHGGAFDRFDSFLFSIIFYSISINI